MKHTMCQCEHESHFDSERNGTRTRHAYGEERNDVRVIQTTWGPFAVCAACAVEHHGVVVHSSPLGRTESSR